jgi:hypothetical protein
VDRMTKEFHACFHLRCLLSDPACRQEERTRETTGSEPSQVRDIAYAGVIP